MRSLVFVQIAILLILSHSTTRAQLWGMTEKGGVDGAGTIFRLSSTGGSPTTTYSFQAENPGARPSHTQMIEGPDGIFYGVTSGGGSHNLGVLFSFDPATGEYSRRVDFTGMQTGANPYGYLIVAANGKIYGTTERGGANNVGGLFEYDIIRNRLTLKWSFVGIQGNVAASLGVVEGNDGKLYGMTYYDGTANKGMIYRLDPGTGVFLIIYNFSNDADGKHPSGRLFRNADGTFYGTTESGGANGAGVIFHYDPVSNVYTKKFDFLASAGAYPRGFFTAHPNGMLYGVTQSGGSSVGVLFEYDTASGSFSKKADFTFMTGQRPNGALALATNGKLYGLTSEGGDDNLGTLVEFDPATSAFVKKVDFDGLNGSTPYGSLAVGSDGMLYGMTSGGGAADSGTIFQFDTETGTLTKRVELNIFPDGSRPLDGLIEDDDGNLVGLLSEGGAHGCGVLFAIDPLSGAFTKKHDFDCNSGKSPAGRLSKANNGKYYGVTAYGGAHDMGVLFEYDPVTDSYGVRVDFSATLGSFPRGSLAPGENGELYGVTTSGGDFGDGVLFEFDPVTGTYTRKFNFNGTDGAMPVGSLVRHAGGTFFGLASGGGDHGYGVLFEFDPSNGECASRIHFDLENGAFPSGELTLTASGRIFGLAAEGGANGFGALFEYAPSENSLTVAMSFTEATGTYPRGSLVESSNDKLYGMTSAAGGPYRLGTMFEFDPSSSSFRKITVFNGDNGAAPSYNTMLFVREHQSITFDEITAEDLLTSTFSVSASATSGLPVAFFSSDDSIASVNGTTVQLHRTGTVTIKAGQGGDRNYKPADSVSQQITITVSAPEALGASRVVEDGFTARWRSSNVAEKYLLDVSADNFLTFVPGFENRQVMSTRQVVTGLARGSEYKYRVRAVFEPDTSAYSNVITVITADPPDAPVAHAATEITSTGFTASWEVVQNAVSYRLDVSADGFYTFVQGYDDKVIEGMQEVVAGLQPWTAYEYRVRAVSDGGTSENSNVIKVFTPAATLGQPVLNDATQVTQTTFVLSWAPVPDAKGYMIEISTDNFETFVNGYNGKVVSSLSDTVSGLLASTAYHFRVRAFNDFVTSEYSTAAVVLTLEKISQVITISPIDDKVFGDPAIALSASASSGLPVSFTTADEEVVIDGSLVILLRPGTATITAIQEGNDVFDSATASITFCIDPPAPVISLNEETMTITSDQQGQHEWFLDGGVLPEEHDQSIRAVTTGAYSTRVTVDGCQSELSTPLQVLVTSIEGPPGRSCFLYPNPVHNSARLDLPDVVTQVPAEIRDVNGRIVMRLVLTSSTTIDLSDLAAGFYMLRVQAKHNIISAWFVKL